MKKTYSHAFSLIELSIVLMIIGFMIGGIVGGKALIRSSELQSVLVEKDAYISATNSFRQKYDALPGDMPNATTYWGAAHADPATCQTTVGTGTQTCNGNGDNNIGMIGTAYEKFRFWQQLANAGFVEGGYTGVAGSGSQDHAVIATNVPKSKMKLAGFHVAYIDPTNPDYFSSLHYTDTLLYGGQTADEGCKAPVITAEEAWSLDQKVDDGKPGMGRIQAPVNGTLVAPICTTTAVPSSAAYAITTSGTICSLAFILGH